MTTLHRAAGKRFTLELTLNGQRRSGQAEPRMLLCDFCVMSSRLSGFMSAASMASAEPVRSWSMDAQCAAALNTRRRQTVRTS